jgi:hypothetical protein
MATEAERHNLRECRDAYQLRTRGPSQRPEREGGRGRGNKRLPSSLLWGPTVSLGSIYLR